MSANNASLRKQLEAIAAQLGGDGGSAYESLDAALVEWTGHLLKEGRSESTVKLYPQIIKTFSAKYGLDVLRMDSVEVLNVTNQVRAKLSPRTCSVYFAVLRVWAEFMGAKASTEALKAPRLSKTPIKPPSLDDIQEARDAFRVSKHDRSETARAMRQDGMVYDVLFEGACRVGEILYDPARGGRYLKLRNVKVATGKGKARTYTTWNPRKHGARGEWPTHLHVIGKGNKERYVPLTATARRGLFNWLMIHRESRGPLKTDAVFTTGEAPYRAQSFRRSLKRVTDRLGLDDFGGKTHHGRRARLSHLIGAGMPTSEVISVSGHNSVAELAPYVALADDPTDSFEKYAASFTARRSTTGTDDDDDDGPDAAPVARAK